MSDIILLDTGPLGLVTHPKSSAESDKCNRWLRSQITKGTRVLVPGISDYELRREMLQIGSTRGIAKLDALKSTIGFAPISTDVMNQAAEFWAQARKMGKPTAADKALDGDMILAAHAAVIAGRGHRVVVATTNVKHLELFCDARLWEDIT
jgi:predicted nucleic acid-binding protein